MKNEEELAEAYLQNHGEEILGEIRKAFLEGYRNGVNKTASVEIDGVTYHDLGLPSGTLWSGPVTVNHPYMYITYDRQNYNSVCGLDLPSWGDYSELIKYCRVLIDENTASKDVVIVGPNGNRLSIGTRDYHNNGNGTLCHRCGEDVPEGKNRVWLKSEVDNGFADAIEVDYNYRCLNARGAKHFTEFKLPYILVKRKQNQQ